MAAADSARHTAGAQVVGEMDMDDLGTVAAGTILFLGGLVRGGFLGKVIAVGGAALALRALRSAAERGTFEGVGSGGAFRDDGFRSAGAGPADADWEHTAAGQEARREGYYRRVDPDARGDEVTEASEESFPASDAPSWTPTTGTGG